MRLLYYKSKRILTNPKHSYDLFYIKKSKAILTNPKYLYNPHSHYKNNHIKKHAYESQKNLTFSSFPFSNIKKRILTNPSTIFCLFLFQILKKHTYESQNTWHSFFAYSLFQILKKEYLQILAQFFTYSFFKY